MAEISCSPFELLHSTNRCEKKPSVRLMKSRFSYF